MPVTPNQQLHIAICDDESIDRQRAADLTNEISTEEGLACSLSIYGSAMALLNAIQGGTQFHILLLDVMMDGLDGMALAAALRELGDSTLQHAQLREALLYCYKTFCEKKEILLPTTKGQRRIPLASILYAEAMERVTKLALTDRVEELSIKFSNLTLLLPERQFVFCHRSYLVNLEQIAYIRSRELELTSGEILPVSRYRLEDLQKRFVGYLRI